MVIKYSKDSLKFLSKLDKKSVARIRAAIQDLTCLLYTSDAADE